MAIKPSSKYMGKDLALLINGVPKKLQQRFLEIGASCPTCFAGRDHMTARTFYEDLRRRRRSGRIAGKLQDSARGQWIYYAMVVWFYKYLLPLHDTKATCLCKTSVEEFMAKATETVLALLERERKGEGTVARAQAKGLVGILVAMGRGGLSCYEKDLETAMLDGTAEYYSRKAASWIEVCSWSEYLSKAEKALQMERKRVESYLHPSSEPKVAERVRRELLLVYSDRLLEDDNFGVRGLIREGKTDDLKRIFRLYVEIPKMLKQAAELFQRHVAEEVTGLLQGAKEASGFELMKKLIELHGQYNTVCVDACFDKHAVFQRALTEAFDQLGDKSVASGVMGAEQLATFCDRVLRKGRGGSEKMSFEAIDKTLESIIRLLTWVHEKDLFAEFYWQMLSNRLLSNRIACIEREKRTVAKLKQQLDFDFTAKMEGMLSDMTKAKETQESFEKYLCANPDEDCNNISFTVLTDTKWPSHKSLSLAIPDEMARSVEAFTQFYSTKHPERKLTWPYSLGTCHIQTRFAAKTIELVVSTCQAIVLTLFDSDDTLSYSDIKTKLNIDDEDYLVQLLHSLSCGKYKILVKKPDNKTVSDSDIFEFNAEFDSAKERIRIPLLAVAGDERKKVVEAVDNDCAIMRIMKRMKVWVYQRLMEECVEVLSPMFKPQVKMLKIKIENLIDKEFLERDQEDSSVLNYLPRLRFAIYFSFLVLLIICVVYIF